MRAQARLQVSRMELVGEKFVLGALIDQQRQRRGARLDETGRVVGFPGFAVVAQIGRETTAPQAHRIGLQIG